MRLSDAFFRVIVTLFAALIPLSLLALLVLLVHDAWPAIRFNGVDFLFKNAWNLGNQYGNPVTVRGQQVMPGASFAILFLIVGTLASSLIALLIAVPLGVGAAVFLAEAVPARIRIYAALLVELLASVPSVVFGLWGYVVLIPFLSRHVYPHLARWLAHVPFSGRHRVAVMAC